MPETIQEYVDSGGERLRVDRQAGILHGVKLLGLTSLNGRRYREDALREAAPLYEGAKVNVNHPKGSPLAPRDYQDRIGVIRQVEFRNGQGLFGELHFNPKHRLSEQLIWDAQHQPANVGLSHNVLAKTARDGNEMTVETITKVQSVDLVADPAATKGLFEQQESTEVEVVQLRWDALTLEHLRLHRPDLVEEAEQHLREELQSSQRQLAELKTREAVACRRGRVLELLSEHRLPLPQAGGTAEQIIGQQFLDSLMDAPDDETLQRLVEERASLVRSASGWRFSASNDRAPTSREQTSQRGSAPDDRPQNAQQFAALLRG